MPSNQSGAGKGASEVGALEGLAIPVYDDVFLWRSSGKASSHLRALEPPPLLQQPRGELRRLAPCLLALPSLGHGPTRRLGTSGSSWFIVSRDAMVKRRRV